MNSVDDDILTGSITPGRQFCQVANCRHYTRCLLITDVHMPTEVPMEWTVIALRDTDGNVELEDGESRHIQYIGIGCGHYAKFHRQVVHITYKRQRPSDNSGG